VTRAALSEVIGKALAVVGGVYVVAIVLAFSVALVRMSFTFPVCR
jgi:hypothetical protein